jgi:hypothetical protein
MTSHTVEQINTLDLVIANLENEFNIVIGDLRNRLTEAEKSVGEKNLLHHTVIVM